MKCALKVIGVVVYLVIVLVIGAVLARDRLITLAARKIVASKTGFGLDIKNLHVALLQPGLELEGLRLTNPSDFPETDALAINKLKISYDWAASTKTELRLPEVMLDLPRVVIVRKTDGEVNFQRFAKQTKTAAPAGGGASAPQPQPPAEKKTARTIRIDHLNIRLGTVYIRTYVQGEKEPREQKYTMNVNQTFENVTDLKAVGAQLFLAVMLQGAPDALLNLGAGLLNGGKDLGQGAGNQVNLTGDQLKNAGKQLQQSFKGLWEGLKQ